ncbi:MAG: hypothetical protein WBC44_19040 [Planctomycetaceae bacterium]
MIQSRPNELRPDEPASFEGGSSGNTPHERFGQETERMKRKAGDTVRETGEKMREAGRQTKNQIVQTTKQTSVQVQQRASEMLADKKSRAADEVGVFGQALHRAADTLDENDDGAVGRYVHQAADLVDSGAEWLRNKSASEMVRGCGDFTRRHPEIVLGGLFLAGVAVARFLKASDRSRSLDDSDFEGNFGEGHYGAMSDMDLQRDLESGDEFGYRDEGFGDIGMYAGSQRGMSTQAEDIPDVTSSQPGSSSSMPTSQSTDMPKPIRDDDLGTIGRNEPTTTDPSKPC